MVKIGSREFNKDMGSYIGKRRLAARGWIFGKKKNLPSKPKQKAEINPDVEVEYKKPGLLSKLFSFRRGMIKEAENSENLSPEEMAKLQGMEDEIEDTEEKIARKEEEVKEIKQEEEVLVEKRETLLASFFNKINFFKRKKSEDAETPSEEYVEEVAVVPEDIIEVIKIAHKWMGELTPGKKRSFKASADFQKYKQVLEKYNLAKEKKEE
ncbi:hypothetical protein JW756_01135 [Candidatus Woesearchaeota archaeon]|nr:hypothetical protein [Candidatus Woesearchaeota archaeon]